MEDPEILPEGSDGNGEREGEGEHEVVEISESESEVMGASLRAQAEYEHQRLRRLWEDRYDNEWPPKTPHPPQHSALHEEKVSGGC